MWKYILIVVGGVLFFLSSIFAFTPAIWYVEGRRDESYPELFFLFIGMPISTFVVMFGVVSLVLSRRKAASLVTRLRRRAENIPD